MAIMTSEASSGDRLRTALDAALAREAQRLGDEQLRWDEREASHIAAACRAADHVEILQARLAAEVDGEDRATVVVKLAAEIRQQDRCIGDHLAWLQLDEFAPPAKSLQHTAAARARWGAERPKRRVG
jgi:hypothetical protein